MERILVVEDDRAVQKALKRLFEAEGFAVEISGDGKSALEAYRAAIPAAVVLDLRLPAMSRSRIDVGPGSRVPSRAKGKSRGSMYYYTYIHEC